ncbi:MAG TPA: sulfatase [Planctomycetota bacterium]|nr:sulfatase [Planctomycetota bacterium]
MASRLNRREFLGVAGAAAVTASRAALSGEAPAAQRPPNFIILFADDQGYADVGCFGAPKIKTPNLDRMAVEGRKFTSFYVSAPVCTPSRSTLMTGCYAQRVSLPNVLFPNSQVGISGKEVTIAELLKARGYATACVGKWHLGHLPQFLPTRHGFDSYLGIPYSNDMWLAADMAIAKDAKLGPGLSLDDLKKGNRKRNDSPLLRNEEVIEYPVDQTTLTERYTEEAIRFITASKDKPFLLYLPHTMPHYPLHVSERFKGKSATGLYGDVIECLDWSTGQILDTLRKLGIDQQTCVIYTSDNGPAAGSAVPLRGRKGSTWEGGMREPCILRWPGHIPAGTTCDELAATMDLLPTFAKLAGTQAPTDRVIDGRDIWPLMAGVEGARTPHEAYFYYRGYSLEAVRSGNWKLHFPRREGRKGDQQVGPALYDLAADIGEANNVAGAHADVVKRLEALAAQMREDIGDGKKAGKNRRPPGTVG